MIINKTLEYRRLNNTVNTYPYLDISHIRTSIDDIQKIIKVLRIKQEKFKLPSFENKNKKRLEIFKYVEIIKNKLNDLDKEIKNIETKDLVLKKKIANYLSIKFKIVMLEFKQVQQEFLNYSCNIFDENTKSQFNLSEEQFIEEEQEIENINEIKKNIYDISNLILEMRIVIQQGSLSIDRLDINYHDTFINTENVNKELKVMVDRYKGIKDKIVILLFVIVSVLSFLCFLKYKHKR